MFRVFASWPTFDNCEGEEEPDDVVYLLPCCTPFGVCVEYGLVHAVCERKGFEVIGLVDPVGRIKLEVDKNMISVISFRRYIVRYHTRGPQKSDDNLDDNLLETFVTHCEPRSTCHEPSGSSMTCNVCTSLLCESPTIPDTPTKM